ncbi:MAG: hypothetical protein II148_06495, partial [Selenomonas sp.]|nr:hypothetical protein [Selenomonas sp.]
MKKSLKLISLLLALVMVLSLGACGSKTNPSGSSAAPQGSTAAPQGSTSSGSQLAGTYDIKVWCPENAVSWTKEQIDSFNKSNTDGIVINA